MSKKGKVLNCIDVSSLMSEECKAVKVEDQEWRKGGPIIMNEGVVVNSDMKIDIKDCNEMKSKFVEKLKFMSKVTRGVYSGVYQDDREYIDFCDSIMNRFIEEEGEDIAQQNIDRITNIMKTKFVSKRAALPNSNPVHLRSNPIVDEVIKIDLTEELTEEQKRFAIDDILKKKHDDPLDDPISGTCKSCDAGKSIAQAIINQKEKKEKIKEGPNLCGNGCFETELVNNISKINKAKKKTTKKKVAKKKVAKKKVKKNDRK